MTAQQELTKATRLDAIDKEIEAVDAAIESATDLDAYDALTALRGQLLNKKQRAKKGEAV